MSHQHSTCVIIRQVCRTAWTLPYKYQLKHLIISACFPQPKYLLDFYPCFLNCKSITLIHKYTRTDFFHILIFSHNFSLHFSSNQDSPTTFCFNFHNFSTTSITFSPNFLSSPALPLPGLNFLTISSLPHIYTSTLCLKKGTPTLSTVTLERINRFQWFLAHILLTILAIKWLFNFPPHPTSSPTLPGENRTNEILHFIQDSIITLLKYHA